MTSGAKRILKKRARDVNRALKRLARRPDEESIHDARTALRRASSVITLLARSPDEKRARRAQKVLRRIRSAMASGRDAQVSITQLKESGHDVDRRVGKRLRKALRNGERDARTSAAQHRHQVKKALAHVESSDASDVRERIAGLASVVTDRARTLVAAPTFDNVHGLRKALRGLRYALEGAEQLGLDGLPEPDAFKPAIDTLGNVMDLRVSAETVSRMSRGYARAADALYVEAVRQLGAATRTVTSWVALRA